MTGTDRCTNKDVVVSIAEYYLTSVKKKLHYRLASCYIVGSYAVGKISLDRPDINFLLIFKEKIIPADYLTVGRICQDTEEKFAEVATVKIEFRPFRYIQPHFHGRYEVSINPRLTSNEEIQRLGGAIGPKWIAEGMKAMSKRVFGEPILEQLHPGPILRSDIVRAVTFDLAFFTIPLSYAPAQYSTEECGLLLNESLVNAKNIASLGIIAAMTSAELTARAYIHMQIDKNKMVPFYATRYGSKYGAMVEKILDVREHYLEYRNNPEVAEDMFSIALELGNAVRKRVTEG